MAKAIFHRGLPAWRWRNKQPVMEKILSPGVLMTSVYFHEEKDGAD